MDKIKLTAKEILESYKEIIIDNEITENLLVISLQEKKFLFLAPIENNPSSTAGFYLINDNGFDFPHIMLTEKDLPIEGLPEGKYRWICLYENESMVNSIISNEDKIIDAVDRLLELLSMNATEREREFQKEFMFYWNSQACGGVPFDVYLCHETSFSKLNVYYSKRRVRLVEEGVSLSDIDSREKDKRVWNHHIECDAYFIPIIDSREILPPHYSHDWNAYDIQNILYPKQIEHISEETFREININVPKTQNVILAFGLRINGLNIVFAVQMKCSNHQGHTLLEKVLYDVESVEPLYTNRKDYRFMSKLIGNDMGLHNKKVLIVGAGSLGSYVASEIAKNGFSHLEIYDGDKLEDANVLRWMFTGLGRGYNKANTIGFLISLIHPEIVVDAHDTNIDEKKLIEVSENVNYIIITIGNSDTQLKFNRVLKKSNCKAIVIYVWLEAGGYDSHILVVDYTKKGCYECLFTDDNGNMINNRASKNTEPIDVTIVKNGCGGTRAAYGTAIILRTVSALLSTIRKIESQEILTNILIDVTEDYVKISDLKFPTEVCACCGDKLE